MVTSPEGTDSSSCSLPIATGFFSGWICHLLGHWGVLPILGVGEGLRISFSHFPEHLRPVLSLL